MIGRRWDAWFGQGNLAVRRRRILPWSKATVIWIPLGTILDFTSLSTDDWTRRRAQVRVQNQAAPHLVEIYDVQFAPESWLYASYLIQSRTAAPPAPPQRRPAPSPPTIVPPHTGRSARPKSSDSPQAALLKPGPPAKPRVQAPKTAPGRRDGSTAPVRATDGKRQIWLWTQNGKIHASLAPVGMASPHRLDPADIARLLLAEPSKAMPAIRALTGINDYLQALLCVQSWRGSGGRVVDLSASDLAGRRTTKAPQRPAGMNPDGSVRTVSGGLPSLGKRYS